MPTLPPSTRTHENLASVHKEAQPLPPGPWPAPHTCVCAALVVIHKLLAGLLDAYELCNITRALRMAQASAEYHLWRIENTLRVNGTARWQQMLEVEFGGMNEVMYRLWMVTGRSNDGYLRMAHLFDKVRWDHHGVRVQS